MARSAEMKARACASVQEECFTERHRNQNIARHGAPEKVNESPMNSITSMIMEWFFEYRDVDVSNIYSSSNRHQGNEMQR